MSGGWSSSAGGGGTSTGSYDAAIATSTATTATATGSVSTNLGAQADTRATWYDASASLLSLAKLAIAAYVDAGSHVHTYNADGTLATDAWTLFGITRTKTFTYTSGQLTGVSDWV